MDPKDRSNKQQSSWSGDHDANDVEVFDSTLRLPHHFHGIHEPVPTCDTAVARSRIDRVYSNHHVADQDPRVLYATARTNYIRIDVVVARLRVKFDEVVDASDGNTGRSC